jgi:multidrug efflux pump
MVLVFLVTYLFLQNLRYTLIPTIVAPIALLGTFAVLLAIGFSINILTLFGMVLAIGIIVDDAIVVIENVERIMTEQGLAPKPATEQAMREITGAVVGITLVLTAVLIPMALVGGSVGVIYRQFTAAMAVSILLSALLALSLTPALCATLLRPAVPHPTQQPFFAFFNRGFYGLTTAYENKLKTVINRPGRAMIVFALIVALLTGLFLRLPTAFLPEEDQGYFLTSFQLPSDATAERTKAVVKHFEQYILNRPAVHDVQVMLGFGFSGSGPNTALAFTVLKDWNERHGVTAQNEIAQTTAALADVHDAQVVHLMPPIIGGLGNSSGFELQLQDRANRGAAALGAARDQLIEAAAHSRLVAGVAAAGLPDGQTLRLLIDREKAETFGVPFAAINDTLSGAMGSVYVNDFPNQGRLQQVIVQADASARMQIDDVLKLQVRNNTGGMVPLSELVTPVWTRAPLQLTRYSGFPAIQITGVAAHGRSTGDAMAEMERLAAQLPPGFAVDWTGQSLQERESGAQVPLLLTLSLLTVFLVLAALYESWSIPTAVLIVVPLGLIGAVIAMTLRGLPNDIFFKVGMITLIGLSAKNAILIVEFATTLHAQGRGLVDATVLAARLRFRPILMTSLAFTLGVMPLMLATGANATTQHAVGTGVFGGMLTATALAIFFVPVFLVVVFSVAKRLRKAAPSDTASPLPRP